MAELSGINAALSENASEDRSFLEKYLTFYIENQLYAIPSNQVIEIISMQQITYMPKLPDYVRGVINIRGKIVPLIDLRMRFGKAQIEYGDHTCIIVSEVGDNSVGFIVDRVNDVADIPASHISLPPSLSGDSSSRFLSGVCKLEGGIAMLLNAERILADDDLTAAVLEPVE